jgi:spore germination protein GerM
VLALVITAAVLAALLPSCGVGTEDTPRVADPADVPFGLLDTTPTAKPSTTLPATEPATVYFVREDPLVPVTRRLAGAHTANARLMSLARGPDQAESAAGIRTALPSGDLIGNVREGGGAVQIELTASVADLADAERLLLAGQIVLTAAGGDSTIRVTFSQNGDPIAVPRPDAEPSSAPVTRAAYASLLAG